MNHELYMNQELYDAVKYGDLEKVKYIISLGADIRRYDDVCVQWASQHGHLEIVKYLVSLGADFRSFDDVSVLFASQNGHLEIVKYLVSLGADIRCLTPAHQKYILFCQKMEEKKKVRAQKKIYYWWIQICYDPKTTVGKRMLEKSWIEFDKIQKNN